MIGEEQGDPGSNQSNFQLSTSLIRIDPASQTGQLLITNLHHSYCFCFKVPSSSPRSKPVSKKCLKYAHPRESSRLERRPL